MKKITFGLLLVLATPAALASHWEYTLGGEVYRETYREYVNGSERFMQQRAHMHGLSGAATYHFNPQSAVILEGRYVKGKSHYVGSEGPSEEKPEGTPYGSVTIHGTPRNSYDLRALYQHHFYAMQRDWRVQVGGGYRILNDLNSRKDAEDYDRKNRLIYAHIGVSTDFALPNGFTLSPKIGYNQLIRARQYSYIEQTAINKQRNGKGLEFELGLSKVVGKGKVTFSPFYRGWKVFDSNRIVQNTDGEIGEIVEPKNITHEVGVKLSYTF
ncbi:porin family protein [Pasteurellaceae bacterium HPA106]|uniref:hypothetical protein n=1 Tax=Spirabiliibacterium pneumoniae TaxID=221400 RepID=UPI001AADF450|nr:hypothetical protein [Spirabiliibacterium pneumoniae]MBE2896500.1 porin family protein [Spirabiliibacterium pneumoniae]